MFSSCQEKNALGNLHKNYSGHTVRGMSEFSKRLQKRMNELALTQEDVARIAGVSQTTVHKLLSGKSKQSRKIIEIAAALGVDPFWLSHGESTSPPTQMPVSDVFVSYSHSEKKSIVNNSQTSIEKIPISCRIPLIEWQDVWVENKARITEDFIGSPIECGSRAFALAVVGHAMADEYREGEFIIVDPDAPVVHGCDLVCELASSARVLRRFEKGEDGEFLIAINPRWPDPIRPVDSGTKVVGRVVGSFRKR